MHVQVGENGGHGLVAQPSVGNLTNQNPPNHDIDAGICMAELKIVGPQKICQAKVIYVIERNQTCATKQRNAIVIQENFFKPFRYFWRFY